MSTATAAGTAGAVVRSALMEDADAALARLFSTHYAGLVRLAALLLRSSAEAEEIVQDAFVELHRRWSQLRQQEAAAAYLRRTVVHSARSIHRHQAVADKHRLALVDVPTSGDARMLAAESRVAVIDALHRLPQRQREVLVLRYYADLPEVDIAATLDISRGAVKSHASRGFAALRSTLEDLS